MVCKNRESLKFLEIHVAHLLHLAAKFQQLHEVFLDETSVAGRSKNL